jgi:hypothetical protein
MTFQTLKDTILSEDFLFYLLSLPSRRTPLQREDAAMHVSTFLAIIAVYAKTHPDKVRAVHEWLNGWIYPLLEFGIASGP